MNRQRSRILTATAAGSALVAAALAVLPAQATPPSKDLATTILAKSLFDEIHVKAHTPTSDRWNAKIKTPRAIRRLCGRQQAPHRGRPPAGTRIPALA
jgi:hypothetical protein